MNFDSTGTPICSVIIEQTLSEQSKWGEFICRKCRNWAGGCSCIKNVFIMAEGCNLENCIYFEEERRKGT